MGTGIAQVCAQAGYEVHLVDIKSSALEKALAECQRSLERLHHKNLLKEPPERILGRIMTENDLKSACQVSWVIEAVPEIEGLKKEIFHELDSIASPTVPLATNTSSIPVTRIAQATKCPERVLGLHFFGPVPLMGLAEVIKGEKTSMNVFMRGYEFIKSLGKIAVRVNRDIPGFVMNRIFSAAFNEALDLVAEGIAIPEEIDIGMKLGYGWNAGPFEIADNAGLDTFALVGKSFMELGETRLTSRSNLIEQMIQEGRLGRKAGKGFYMYSPEGKRLIIDKLHE